MWNSEIEINELSVLSGLSKSELLTTKSLNKIVTQCYKNLFQKISNKKLIISNNIKFDGAIKGGYVKRPIGGYFKDVFVLDMDAMYPSIMIAFNLGPETTYLTESLHNVNLNDNFALKIEASKYVISRKHPSGLLSESLKYLLHKRSTSDHKKFYKLLCNVCYGLACKGNVLFGGKIVAAATTQYGRMIMKSLEKCATSFGYIVIYIDTDALFLTGKKYYDFLPDELIEKSLGKNLKPFFKLKKEYHFKTFQQNKPKQYQGITTAGIIINKGFFKDEQFKKHIIINQNENKLCLTFHTHRIFNVFRLFTLKNCNHQIQYTVERNNTSCYINPPVFGVNQTVCISSNMSTFDALLIALVTIGLSLIEAQKILNENETFVIEIKNFCSLKSECIKQFQFK